MSNTATASATTSGEAHKPPQPVYDPCKQPAPSDFHQTAFHRSRYILPALTSETYSSGTVPSIRKVHEYPPSALNNLAPLLHAASADYNAQRDLDSINTSTYNPAPPPPPQNTSISVDQSITSGGVTIGTAPATDIPQDQRFTEITPAESSTKKGKRKRGANQPLGVGEYSALGVVMLLGETEVFISQTDENGNENTAESGEGGEEGEDGARPLKNTKRAAQNRAAQRAFRERKEQHMKELEIKAALVPALESQLETLHARLHRAESTPTERSSFIAARQAMEDERQKFEADRKRWNDEREEWERSKSEMRAEIEGLKGALGEARRMNNELRAASNTSR